MGCIFGPLVTACVALDPNSRWSDHRITDSKKMAHKVIYEIAPIIQEKVLSFGIGIIPIEQLNKTANVFESDKIAMRLAYLDCIKKMTKLNGNSHIYIDGRIQVNFGKNTTCKAIIKGDSLVFGISCASVIAKNYRDQMMFELAENHKYGQYGIDQHKGYGTKLHYERLKQYGVSDQHRIFYLRNFKQNE